MPIVDTRLVALTHWITATVEHCAFTMAPASADASFRRYFRIVLAEPWRDNTSLIAMDAPPPMEDCRPFVHVSKLLLAAGVNAPEVLAADIERGLLLLTDLGDVTYLGALDQSTAKGLYLAAIDSLVRWQLATREGELPPYDKALLHRELMLFPDWYVTRHLDHTLTTNETQALQKVFRAILDNTLAQPQVFVHRDYHSRNLMVSAPNPGVLDFQDAVLGPITYDLVSLLRDAYVTWDEALEIDLAVGYWERARTAALPVKKDFAIFWRDLEWMGVQRQLKVLGIFARLYHRDGKASYLADMPRVMAYLRRSCRRYDALHPLLRLLDSLAVIEPVAGRGPLSSGGWEA